MQAGDRKKLVFLAVLLAGLAAIWVYRALTGGDAGRTGDTGGGPGRAAVILPDAPVSVRMDLLERERPDLRVGRNIFDPAYKKPVVKPPPPTTQPGQPVARPAGPPPPPPPPPKSREELMREKAEAEMKNFRFMGFLKRADRTDVFLALNSDYYVATVGATITKGYYLKSIGPDHLLFADRDSGAQARVDVNFDKEDKGPAVPTPGGSGGAQQSAGRSAAPEGVSPADSGGAGQVRRLPETSGVATTSGGGAGTYNDGGGGAGGNVPAPAVIINRSVR